MIYELIFGNEPLQFRYSEDATEGRAEDENAPPQPGYGIPTVGRFRELQPTAQINKYFTRVGPIPATEILRTCKQIYTEALPMVFKERVLKVAVDPWTEVDDGQRCYIDLKRSPWTQAFRLSKHLNPVLSPAIRFMDVSIDDCILEPGIMHHVTINSILRQGNDLVAALPGIQKLTLEVVMRLDYDTWGAHHPKEWSEKGVLFNHIREVCRAEGMRIKTALHVKFNPGIWIAAKERNDPDLFVEAWDKVKALRRV